MKRFSLFTLGKSMTERVLCSPCLLLVGSQFWFIPLLMASTLISWFKVASASLPHCRVAPLPFVKPFIFHDERRVVSCILGCCLAFGYFYIFPGNPRVPPTLRIGGLIPLCEKSMSKDIGAFVTWVNTNKSLRGLANVYRALTRIHCAPYCVRIVALI